MKMIFALIIISVFSVYGSFAQTSSLKITTSVSNEIKSELKSKGRILLFVNSRSKEPRRSTWPHKSNLIFATNIENWNGQTFTFDQSVKLVKSRQITLDNIPNGKYYVQVLWDQNFLESRINAPGNFHSNVVEIELNGSTTLDLPLTKIIEPIKLAEHELLKEVDIKSEILSDWWGKDMHLKAAVILPRNYFKENKKYPVRYNIAGYGGRYTRASRFLRDMEWWQSEEAPEVIQVYLDGEGPFGDCYQLDSENSGPYGKALTEELIPYLEKEFRGIGTPETRFVDGCSTGGWVSLALQLVYPDFFGGCFSYSPDQVDFEHCQLVNIYKDENAFINEHGYLRPLVREVTGEPIISQKDFIQYENVLGYSDTYVTSGGQFSAFTALFSPKGEDGFPKPMFDPITGDIDREVTEHWRKYDLKDYVETNWETLGPKIQDKIWIWGADMDNFYLNPALRSFDEMLQQQNNPTSDAQISFTPMAGHCQEYSHKKVLLQIKEKLNSSK
ncbi:esterase family protein [Draconibacterium sp.]|nr:esterase family protein [Draconibacterium sp.]